MRCFKAWLAVRLRLFHYPDRFLHHLVRKMKPIVPPQMTLKTNTKIFFKKYDGQWEICLKNGIFDETKFLFKKQNFVATKTRKAGN